MAKRSRSDEHENAQATLAVMVSYRIHSKDEKVLKFWGDSWGRSRLISLTDMQKYAPLIHNIAKATEWNCFLDVSLESIYDDDQPEDDTAVPTYHKDDARKLECVEALLVLQGEVSKQGGGACPLAPSFFSQFFRVCFFTGQRRILLGTGRIGRIC